MKNSPARPSSSKSRPAAQPKHRPAQKKPEARAKSSEAGGKEAAGATQAQGARRASPSAKKEREASPQRDLGGPSKAAQRGRIEKSPAQKAHGFQLVAPSLSFTSTPAPLPFDGGRFLQQAQEGIAGLGQGLQSWLDWPKPGSDVAHSDLGKAPHSDVRSKIISSAVDDPEAVLPSQTYSDREKLARTSSVEQDYESWRKFRQRNELSLKVRIPEMAHEASQTNPHLIVLGITKPLGAFGRFIEAGSPESLEGVRSFLGPRSAPDGGILARISKFKRLSFVNSKNERLYMGAPEFLKYAKSPEAKDELFPRIEADNRMETLLLFDEPIIQSGVGKNSAVVSNWSTPSLMFNLADLAPGSWRAPKQKAETIEDSVRRVLELVLRSKARDGIDIESPMLQSLMSKVYDRKSDSFDEDKLHRIMDRFFHHEPKGKNHRRSRGRSGALPYQYVILSGLGLSVDEVALLHGVAPRQVVAQELVLKSYLHDLLRDPAMRTNGSTANMSAPLVLGQKQLNHLPGAYLQPGSAESLTGLESFWPQPFSEDSRRGWLGFLNQLSEYSGGKVGLVNQNGNRFYTGTQALLAWLEGAGAKDVHERMGRLMQLGDTFLIFDGPMAKLPGESKEAYATRLGLNVDQVSSGVDFIVKFPPAFSFSLQDLYRRVGEKPPTRMLRSLDVVDGEDTIRSIVREVLRVSPLKPRTVSQQHVNQLTAMIRDESGALDRHKLEIFLDQLFEHPPQAGESELRRQQLILGSILGLLNDELSSIHDFAIDRVGSSLSEARRRMIEKFRHVMSTPNNI